METFPTLFLSHGAPNMGLSDSPVREFMSGLGENYQKPDAIIIASAHFERSGAHVVTDTNPEMIYDFRGFERELYEVQYPAPGAPELAQEVIKSLNSANIPVVAIDKRGYDHGIWVPLSLAWPEADIPIVQISIDPDESPQYHYQLGKALSAFSSRNIVIIGTGNITHNLPALFNKGQAPELDANIRRYVEEFIAWLDSEIESENIDNLLNYKEKAPFSAENHPTDEHFLPLYFALGAAGENFKAKKIHASYTYDFLAMDAWEFTPQ